MEVSPAYRFARNPVSAIRSAVTEQLITYGKNSRLTWKAICEKGGATSGAVFTTWEQFALGVKSLGTGVVLEACDVEIAFGSNGDADGVSFEQFAELLQ